MTIGDHVTIYRQSDKIAMEIRHLDRIKVRGASKQSHRAFVQIANRAQGVPSRCRDSIGPPSAFTPLGFTVNQTSTLN